MTREFVDVEMLKMFPAVPVETLLIMLLTVMADEAKFLLASVTTKEEAVRVAMLRLPKAETWKKEVPEEEATVKSAEVCDEVAIIKAVVWVVEEEATESWAVGVVVPMPTVPATNVAKIPLVPLLTSRTPAAFL